MMPHFTGLDLAGQRVSLETPLVSIYSRQKDAWLDEFFRTLRLRLGTGIIFSRQHGTRAVIRALRDGYRLYYLPDQDFGHRDSVFVPFFGVNAATITGLSLMAAVVGAVVLPCYRSAKWMATRWSLSRRWPTSRAPMPRPTQRA
jgi:Kdo2-lipid IVA lauroyltransferase/acyltransferase